MSCQLVILKERQVVSSLRFSSVEDVEYRELYLLVINFGEWIAEKASKTRIAALVLFR